MGLIEQPKIVINTAHTETLAAQRRISMYEYQSIPNDEFVWKDLDIGLAKEIGKYADENKREFNGCYIFEKRIKIVIDDRSE